MAAGGHGAEWRVLGPFEVDAAGRLVELSRPRLRAVLALLVANAGRVVSVAALVDELWGPHAPADADRTMRSYVSLLRRALSADLPDRELIVTRPPGYVLRLDPDAVDAARFERLATAGQQALAAGQPALASERLAAALALWRGDAYSEFSDTPALRAEAARLEQLRLAALQDRIDADLADGAGAALVAELEGLTGTHPGRERLWGQLMIALYRAGRQTDALAAYRRAREVLVEESGLEPTPVLAEIHQQILIHDPRLLPPPPGLPARAGTPVAGPTQLPWAVRGFTGRARELADLDALLPNAARPGPRATVVISAVSGTAGVGKTALAVHWAHRVAENFPDGQLYVNLRGFDPGGQAMAPAEAVRGFLDALGVPAGRIPPSLDAQAALYRSTLEGRRMLIVLDNARDAEQARPLLPGTPTAMVVITSRNQLTGLVAAGAAYPITLDLLSTAEARELLAGRLGADRVAAEPQAVQDIVSACARLPLALSVAAARAAQTGFPLATLAAELADAGRRLGVLDTGDPATDVRAVLSWSYQALTPPAARLFRLLGLHPGADSSAAAAASLAGQPLSEVRPLLAELTRASLLTEPTPGRYTSHDLLRAYAADLRHSTDTDQHRRAAVGRLLDHYLHTADTVNQLLDPTHEPIPLPLTQPVAGTSPEHPADAHQATAWLATEHTTLLAVLCQAADTGHDTHTWQLACTLDSFVARWGHWHDLVTHWQAALDAAGRLGHRVAQAYAHRLLARSHTRLGRYADADTHHRNALALYAQAGDLGGEANTHIDVAISWGRQGRPDQALEHARRALTLYRAAGRRRGPAYALNAIGWFQAQLGDHTQALTHCEQALTLHRELLNRAGEAETWDSLGYVHHHLGHHTQAIDSYQHALDLYRDLGDRYEEAITLTNLGDTHHAAGNPTAARITWQRALDILTSLDHPSAETLRTKLGSGGGLVVRLQPSS